MNGYMKEQLALSREIQFLRTTASRKVSTMPSYIFSVIIAADSAEPAKGLLYNGESALDDPKLDLRARSWGSQLYSFNPPLFFPKGIYVYHEENIESITIQWATIK